MKIENLEGLTAYDHRNGFTLFRTDDFDSLPGETRLILEPQLVESAAAGFEKKRITAQFEADVADHIRGGDLFMMANEKIRGFALFKYFPEDDAVYISGIVKYPLFGRGMIEEFVRDYLNEKNPLKVITRTQNDRVVEIMDKFNNEVVSLDRLSTAKEHKLLDKLGLFGGSESLDIPELIFRGFYGGPMIESGERQRSRIEKITSLTNKLDYFAGDALLLVGYRK